MEIINTTPEFLSDLTKVYDKARAFMKETGNGNQWHDNYPPGEMLLNDLRKEQSYVCINKEREMLGTFCFFMGPEITYEEIYDGEWLNDEPYGVMHRLATTGKEKGVADFCLKWCFKQCGNLRVDTHEDNKIMQHILEKNGFVRCGIIHVLNGTPRIAYQKADKTGRREKDFTSLSDTIVQIVNRDVDWLMNLPEDVITRRRNKQGRTIKQILGHMIDSASNNHQRMVRLQYHNILDFPDYRQNNDLWIELQDYLHEDWEQLVQLWKYYHFHMAHVINSIDPETTGNYWADFEGTKVPLHDMVSAYLEHFLLHLNEIRELAKNKRNKK